MNLAQRFQRLDAFLAGQDWLWRPQPFKQVRPGWCRRLPALCDALLGLSDEELAWLTEDAEALFAFLSEHVPSLTGLGELTRLSGRDTTPLNDLGPHFSSGIPGRKWQQVKAFAAVVGVVQGPVLEWCGGKGHLGRLLAAQWRSPVVTLEHDADLCEQGRRLAGRVSVDQTFCLDDALAPSAAKVVAGRHAVSLHACGELHRTLVRRALEAKVPALDVAPCCYHLMGNHHYRPFNIGARLKLQRDDLRLAVTETVTAVGREVRLRDREMAWKLGFDWLRRHDSTVDDYQPIKPIDKAWLKGDFAGFCRALAEREGDKLPAEIDWYAAEAAGWQRQRETMRLSLVRHAFRRAIELWLVLDLASFIAEQGYEVQVGSFCDRKLTPRNILISARCRG